MTCDKLMIFIFYFFKLMIFIFYFTDCNTSKTCDIIKAIIMKPLPGPTILDFGLFQESFYFFHKNTFHWSIFSILRLLTRAPLGFLNFKEQE